MFVLATMSPLVVPWGCLSSSRPRQSIYRIDVYNYRLRLKHFLFLQCSGSRAGRCCTHPLIRNRARLWVATLDVGSRVWERAQETHTIAPRND